MRGSLGPVVLAINVAFILPISGRAQGASNADRKFVTLIEAIQRADYQGQRDELRRLAGDLGALELPDRRPYQDYWVGFAWWRRAINGFSESPRPDDLMADLERCEASERQSLSALPGFEDALNGLANCLGMQLYLSSTAAPQVRAAILSRGTNDLQSLRASKEGTANPRTLWVLAGWEASGPNGDLSKSIETLVRGLTLARAERDRPREPWIPAWGGAELLMSLSYLHALPARAEKPVARAFAEAALFLVPDWHYVRDILMPQIAALPEPAPSPKE